MSIKNNTNNQKEMSFIEKARRAQIVECAIETIAEVGYAQASLGQIAKRAKISKGVISYHFTNKKELLEQVVTDYYIACQSFICPQIEDQTSPKGMLQTYVESNLKFIDENRKHVFAVIEIVSNERTDEGKLRFAADYDETIFLPIENILRLGMQEGVFREFSTLSLRVMALTIRHAIDGFSLELMRNPDLNVKDYTKELITIFEQATQK
ncbi:TetR/AcrR family transcriptional regulator [Bacillus pseudomycoides]|uniref:TetR/AcrR family transcriptional regulator n=2 Tax=Bacillus pseudomycoides TaxID=64104 RepID=UPI000BF1CEE1|nr:TetR/AcrR family transcriptional regulator [Bacillus pseudomycoides]PEI47205.1 TetR family transcriptional regulator [Bacillus pseudomycoides]PEP00354.1 TetR family transcriptional regulator [Bacillus pseudomycoides]PGA17919.1 TetR family transcriptional regulator [Bacillus pseudomycoides]PGC45648.1 TetR family transcriptional regulator [Bacillus pseudomycoides]PGD27760.1 TetR family transcriptional regulator [Bacillus pseudomycoides]